MKNNKNNTVQLSARIPRALDEKINEFQRKHGMMKRSEAIRALLQKGINKQ